MVLPVAIGCEVSFHPADETGETESSSDHSSSSGDERSTQDTADGGSKSRGVSNDEAVDPRAADAGSSHGEKSSDDGADRPDAGATPGELGTTHNRIISSFIPLDEVR